MRTKQEFAQYEALKRAHEAAEDAIDLAIATDGPDSQSEIDATVTCRLTIKALNDFHQEMYRKYPPPPSRLGDRGCGKRK